MCACLCTLAFRDASGHYIPGSNGLIKVTVEFCLVKIVAEGLIIEYCFHFSTLDADICYNPLINSAHLLL